MSQRKDLQHVPVRDTDRQKARRVQRIPEDHRGPLISRLTNDLNRRPTNGEILNAWKTFRHRGQWKTFHATMKAPEES